MTRRRFTKEQKLQILKEVEEHGVKVTLAKHGIYPATCYDWKKKYAEMGEAGFRYGREKLKEMRRLEKENAMLKGLLAEEDLKLKMHEELLIKDDFNGRTESVDQVICRTRDESR